MAVEVSGDLIGFSWEGPGTGTFFTFEPQYTFTFQVLGAYTVIAYGVCGNDTAIVNVTAQGAGAGQDNTLHLCDDGPPINLALSLGTHADGGFWTFGGLPHTGIYNPAVDSAGEYTYTAPFPATCPGASQVATILVEETAVGPNTTWTLCSSDPPFNLIDALNPGATVGGSWARVQFLTLLPHGGEYDPAVDSSGIFRYAIGNCSATVQVTEWPASPWFADLDNDGLGDPLTEVWACSQPSGCVSNDSDACPTIPGTVGGPCDDGNPLTLNDHITDSCTCAGDTPSSISPTAATPAPVSIWPNPLSEGVLRLQTTWTGQAEIRVHDVTGRLWMAASMELQTGPMDVFLRQAFAPGSYMLRISCAAGNTALILIVK